MDLIYFCFYYLIELGKNGIDENVNTNASNGFISLDLRDFHFNLLLPDAFDEGLFIQDEYSFLEFFLLV